MSLFGGLVFFAPAALLVRTRAGISEPCFFLLQALLSAVIALGELPTGHLTDRIGYRRSLILSQLLLLAARGLLLAAFLLRSLPLFAAEAVVEGAAGLVCAFLLSQEPRQEAPAFRQGSMWKRLRVVFGSRQALLFTGLLSAFSVAWLLVNFFYAEKLEGYGIPLAWLSAVIMGYSAAQMLAEPILRLCAGRSRRAMTALFCLLSGAALAVFGWLRSPWAALPLMVLLPLLLDLAAFCLEEQQNQFIDRLELGGDRAAALSAMNMGVNLVEVVSLFASSVLAAIGVGWCFALCGALLLSGALVLCRSPRVSPAA